MKRVHDVKKNEDDVWSMCVIVWALSNWALTIWHKVPVGHVMMNLQPPQMIQIFEILNGFATTLYSSSN